MVKSIKELARENAPLVTLARHAIKAGAKAEVVAAVAAGLTFYKLAYTGQPQDRAKLEVIRTLLGAGLEQRKDISFAFAKETLLVGQKMGLFISQNVPVFASAMQQNSDKAAIAELIRIFKADYAATSRNAIKAVVTPKPKVAKASNPAEDMVKAIGRKEGLDFASFGKLLGEALDAKALDAFATAFDAAAKVKREAMAKAAETAAKAAKAA